MPISNLLSKPEFYDVFGSLAFAIITLIAIYQIKKGISLKYINLLLLIIGIIGLIVESIIVYKTFIE